MTQSHLLLLRPSQQPYFNETKLIVPKENEIENMRLVLAAELQSLTEVGQDRTKKNEFSLKFEAIEIKGMEYRKKTWNKSLKVSKSSLFLGCILKSMRRYQVEINL